MVEPSELDDNDSGPEINEEWQLAQLLFRFTWPLLGRLGLMIALTVGRAACLTYVVVFLHAAIASLMTPAGDIAEQQAFLQAAVGLLLCQLGAAVCQYLGDETQRWFLGGVEVGVFEWAVGRLILLPADYFRTRSLLKFVLHIDKLQQAVRAFLNSVTTVVTRSCVIAGIAVGVLHQAPLFAIIGLSALVVVSAIVWRRTRTLRAAAREELRSDLSFIDRVMAIFSNLHDLHSFGLRGQALEQFDDACQGWTSRTLRMARIQTSVAATINMAGIMVLALALGAILMVGSSPASALTAFAAMGLLLEPISEVVRIRSTMHTKAAKLGDILQFNEGRLSERKQQSGGQPLLEPLRTLELQDVSYAVRGVPLLQGINLTLRQGEIVGIIGRSGAGKTTFANVILRLLDPSEGRLLVNGSDATEVDLASYWQQAAAITQIPFRVEGTVQDELRLVQPNAREADLLAALAEAGIDPEVRLHRLEGEEGQGLHQPVTAHSRGLQQRLEWARLWLRPARLVVLDEPTSLADSHMEQQFVQSTLRRRADQITVVVSHRPGTLVMCDRLIVLEAGRIVAEGPRAEILARWLPNLETEGALAS